MFLAAAMNAPGMEKEKAATLAQTLPELLDITEEDLKNGQADPYVDLAITCAEKGKLGDIMKGVPPLRVNLN